MTLDFLIGLLLDEVEETPRGILRRVYVPGLPPTGFAWVPEEEVGRLGAGNRDSVSIRVDRWGFYHLGEVLSKAKAEGV